VKLIVGLGNPGSRYSHTRHNAGRLLVEYLAREAAASFKMQKKLKAQVAPAKFGGEDISLVYPETFMNVSGETLALLTQHFEVDLRHDLLIVVDDIALPFGKWRLRSRGSDGGHNGLKSIQRALGTSAYARLRMGIAPENTALSPEGKISLEEFVLESFDRTESRALPKTLERGAQACKLWAAQPIEQAMSAVNC